MITIIIIMIIPSCKERGGYLGLTGCRDVLYAESAKAALSSRCRICSSLNPPALLDLGAIASPLQGCFNSRV
jgi:hypothetical protein